jgi:UDP-N-acetylmuramoyl-tripeptide--D-alanyl-D-alanine ligase
MRDWNPEQIARAAGAERLGVDGPSSGPDSVVIDSRRAGPGTLFVGLRGSQSDGGEFAAQALSAAAWGVLVSPEHARELAAHDRGDEVRDPGAGAPPVILSASDPLRALQRLARAWRQHLGARVIGVTGSTGKTSTKDLLLALLAPHRRTVASRANFNTEIGLPLEVLGAPAGTEVLVLEMAMRGPGQIAELAAIAQPDVGVIVNIGPVHLELLHTLENIAAAKAELIAGLPAGGTAIIPAEEPLLDPHRRDDLDMVTFGTGPADVRLAAAEGERLTIDHRGEAIHLTVPFTQAHLRTNLLAAVAAARAVGVTPSGRVEAMISPGRGARLKLPGGVTLIDDCYNANPMSMRAALEDLAQSANGGRRVAILGDMLELGPQERGFHEQIGEHAEAASVELLITVGPLARSMASRFHREVHAAADAAQAAELARALVRPGDTVLVKGSRGVGLELVCRTLAPAAPDDER